MNCMALRANTNVSSVRSRRCVGALQVHFSLDTVVATPIDFTSANCRVPKQHNHDNHSGIIMVVVTTIVIIIICIKSPTSTWLVRRHYRHHHHHYHHHHHHHQLKKDLMLRPRSRVLAGLVSLSYARKPQLTSGEPKLESLLFIVSILFLCSLFICFECVGHHHQ